MPHSGGGGSFGGGFHSSSGSSSSGSAAKPRYSKTPFSGAYRYVYYTAGMPRYYYAEKKVNITKKELYFPTFFCLIFLIVGILLIAFSNITPKKINKSYPNKNVLITDNIGIISDQTDLTDSLNSFLDLTGVATEILTVTNETWKSHYSSFTKYLYDYYVDKYKDEYHYIIAYSQPEVLNQDSPNWYFETMVGDDTDSIMTSSTETKISKSIYKSLKADKSFSESVQIALNDTPNYILEPYRENGMIFAGVFVTIFMIAAEVLIIVSYNNNKHMNDSYVVAEDAKEERCEYCGSIYIAGEIIQCPHCGAAIKYKNVNL